MTACSTRGSLPSSLPGLFPGHLPRWQPAFLLDCLFNTYKAVWNPTWTAPWTPPWWAACVPTQPPFPGLRGLSGSPVASLPGCLPPFELGCLFYSHDTCLEPFLQAFLAASKPRSMPVPHLGTCLDNCDQGDLLPGGCRELVS